VVAWKPKYATDELLKDYLQVDSDDDDAFVTLWNATASRNVDGFCGRQFGKVDAPVTRLYRRGAWDSGLGKWVYVIDDLHSTDDLVVTHDDDVPVTGVDFEPLNAAEDGVPYQRVLAPASAGCGPLSFTSPNWGWAAVPESITTGLLLMAARLAARRGSPFGVAGSPSDGSEIRLLARLDPDMIQVLKGGGFRRTWWAA
jgi:hypothetical protein